jgi:hypothetical protein
MGDAKRFGLFRRAMGEHQFRGLFGKKEPERAARGAAGS